MMNTLKTIFLLGIIAMFCAFIDVSGPIINRQELTTPTVQLKKPSFVLNKPEPMHPLLAEVLLPAKGGLIRGTDFGMTRQNIAVIENACATEDADYRTRYSIACSIPEMAAFADVVYDFQPDGQMDMVTIDYFLQDPYLTKAIYHDLLQYYIKQFGQKYYTDADGYVTWETERQARDGDRHTMYIYLKKMGKGEDSGISIQFVKNQDNQ
ncbi:hypothetical protein BH09BAC1_BH09BAC1_01680 [soil metagenome]